MAQTPRNRTIYANELLMVSPTATGNQYLNGDTDTDGESLIRQIKRVQSINYGFSINRTDTYQFGQLARMGSAVLSAPSVSLDFSYYLTDGKNEHLLGFDTNSASNFLHKDFINDGEGRNFYIYTAPDGSDAAADTIAKIEAQNEDNKSVIGIGNGFITNYSLSAAVGAMPTVSVSVMGANIQASQGTDGTSPGIHPTDGTQSSKSYKIPSEYISTGDGAHCLLPGDIQVDLGDGSLLSAVIDDGGTTASHIQSCSVDIPLGRSTLERMGNSFGYAKVLDVPIRANISVSAILADKKATEKSLFNELFDSNEVDLTLTFHKPNSSGPNVGDKVAIYEFKAAKLEAESYGMSIGDSRTVDYTFSATIGDPTSTAGAQGSSISMHSSGVYEQLQVIQTGVTADAAAITQGNQDWRNIAFGDAIAANDDILVVGASGLAQGAIDEIDGDVERGAVFIYKNSKGFYTQQQVNSGQTVASSVSNTGYLIDAADHDYRFGREVAVSQQNIIAVSQQDNTDGPRGGTSAEQSSIIMLHPDDELETWTVRDVVTGIVDTDVSINLGHSIAFDKQGTSGVYQWMVAGAPTADPHGSGNMGQAYVTFGTKNEKNTFTTNVKPLVLAAGANSDLKTSESAHDAGEDFGTAVAMHKNAIVVGAPGHASKSGVAYVYTAVGDGFYTDDGHAAAGVGFQEVAQLSGNKADIADNTPHLGASVDIYDKTIVVGAPSGSSANRGAVVVFTTDEDTQAHGWEYAATLTASDHQPLDHFGTSVSIPNERTIVVGAGKEDSEGTSAGQVYVFTGKGSNWTETQKITYSGDADMAQRGARGHLAVTEKEIFIGTSGNSKLQGVAHDATSAETVIRYRI